MLKYSFEPLNRISGPSSTEIENEINESFPILEKNLGRLLDYLKKEQEYQNYIEIELPILHLGISYKLSILYEKIVITVMKWNSSEIYGHLLIENYDCIGQKDIKKLFDWKTHAKTTNRFSNWNEI
jgi:hypothetical protein